jgi:hypothetical protein
VLDEVAKGRAGMTMEVLQVSERSQSSLLAPTSTSSSCTPSCARPRSLYRLLRTRPSISVRTPDSLVELVTWDCLCPCPLTCAGCQRRGAETRELC